MDWTLFAAVVAAVFIAVLAGTGFVARVLRDRAILDHPNERSSHQQPTPKGAGIVVIPAIAAGWIGISWDTPAAAPTAVVVVAALMLGAVSWRDDLRGLSPLWRLLAQAAAIAAVFALAPPDRPYFGGLLPGALDLVLAGLAWLWFVNLFNFMDGIDGIAGVEAACIGVGIAVVAAAAALSPAFVIYGLVVAAAALGFLWWNWHPARIFLGDVGSVPLGFMLGWLLLGLAKNGQWAAALILPLYYLADATLTLMRRAARGETVWRAHREHFYQRASALGLDHAKVVHRVLLANLALMLLALAAARGWVFPALVAAVAVVALLLIRLAGGGRVKRAGAP